MNDEPEHQGGGTHGANGDFIRTVETAERDAKAARLYSQGKSYRQVAAEVGLSVSNAHAAVQRALKAIVEEPALEVRQKELARLDAMYEAAVKVLETRHVTVSQGRIMRQQVGIERGEDGEPIRDADGKTIPVYEDLLDDAPVLKAIEVLLKIQARRAALLGLDAPAKAEIGGKLSYEIVGVDLGQL